jgi:3-dehydroquinate synthase
LNRIVINTGFQKSDILIGENWTNVKTLIPTSDVVIVTDNNVRKIYGDKFPCFAVISLSPGEESKRFEVIDDIAKKLLEYGIDRTGFILGIGGGVVCDITGFISSIYMRGIRFGYVSSSLLSQVDASIGGKNGINCGPVKNTLGTFRQPEFVICDPSMLKSLPDDEYLSGLAELIKNGIILDSDLVNEIEHNYNGILNRDINLLTRLITRSVEIKASVVREDEKEKGKRMLLNFGHTFGHAIEVQSGLKHGFAVASGMILAVDISYKEGILTKSERDRVRNLLHQFNLIREFKLSKNEFEELITKDKKKEGDKINFVLLETIGKATVKKIQVKKLIDYFKSVD